MFSQCTNPFKVLSSTVHRSYFRNVQVKMAITEATSTLVLIQHYPLLGDYRYHFFMLDSGLLYSKNWDLSKQLLKPWITHSNERVIHLDEALTDLATNRQAGLTDDVDITFLSDRGPLNFHFGHYLTSSLAELALLESYVEQGIILPSYRYLRTPEKKWEHEIVELFSIKSSLLKASRNPSLVDEKKLPNGLIINTSYIVANIAYFKFSAAALRCPSEAGYNINLPNIRSRSKHSIFLLSRSKIKNRPVRWLNEDCFVKSASSVAPIKTIDTCSTSPKELLSCIVESSPSIILASPGSALHQIAIIGNLRPRLCMICGRSSPDIYNNEMLANDFGYCLNRLDIIGLSDTTGQGMWDDDFEIPPLEATELLKFCLCTKSRTSTRRLITSKSLYLSLAPI